MDFHGRVTVGSADNPNKMRNFNVGLVLGLSGEMSELHGNEETRGSNLSPGNNFCIEIFTIQ